MLKIEHLSKTYRGGKKAVDDLNLHVEPGDIYAFVGHNGAGKTTTLKCSSGIIDFDGEIYIDGFSVRNNPLECKRRIAYIPDNPDIYEYLTGIQYLNFIADVFGVSAGERTEVFEKYGKEFGLIESFGDLVSSYSHGMKQKLVLISALCHKPKLLLLDEPFVGLDPQAALILKNTMSDFCKQGGAIFYSTHVLDVAEKLCNKVAIVKGGKLVASGLMSELTRGGTLESLFMEVAVNAEAD